MASRDLKFLSGFGNGLTDPVDLIELPDFPKPPVKSDFYINAPVMKVDKLVTDAENTLLRKLVSYSKTADAKNLASFLDGIEVAEDYESLTRSDIPAVKKYLLKSELLEEGLTATISTVSKRFRKSNIDNHLRYLLSNEVFYVYCLSQSYFTDNVKDADGLFSRVMANAAEIREYLNGRMAENFFKQNKLDPDDIPLDLFLEEAAAATIPFVKDQTPAFLESMLSKKMKYDALPTLVDRYILKGEIDPGHITPLIRQRMIDHLYKMGVKVTMAEAQSSKGKYDEYLALAYSHARRLSSTGNDPVKNLFSDVAVDTFDYKVDYFETIEEQSIDRTHILGAAVLFYTKVLSDDMGLLRIADAIIMAWTQGKLDIPHGETATRLYRYYKLRKERMTAEERSMFYKIVFNTGNAEVLENSVVNTDFPKLWNSLMQETVKYIQKSETNDSGDEFISKVGIYNSIRNLQYNISVFMTGMIKSLLPEMYAQLQSAIEIVKQPEVVSQLGQGYQRNMWKVVERIGAEVFNHVPNVSALKTIAIRGHSIFSAIAQFDDAQFSEEEFRKFISDVEEFIVANGQLDGKVLEEGDGEEEDNDEEDSPEMNEKKGKGEWDF